MNKSFDKLEAKVIKAVNENTDKRFEDAGLFFQRLISNTTIIRYILHKIIDFYGIKKTKELLNECAHRGERTQVKHSSFEVMDYYMYLEAENDKKPKSQKLKIAELERMTAMQFNITVKAVQHHKRNRAKL